MRLIEIGEGCFQNQRMDIAREEKQVDPNVIVTFKWQAVSR